MTDEKMAEEKYCKGCKWRMEQCLWAWRNTNGLNEPNEKNCSCKEVPAFLAGLKAGRTQWHYVKDGDYPDTDRTVLAYSDDVVSGHYPFFAQYYKGFTNAKKNGVDLNWNCWRNNMQRELVEPTVWCEIPTFDKE